MKKLLLLLALLFYGNVVLSQSINQPSQFNRVCDDNNDGFASFYLGEISYEIIGNNQNLVVTHHETQADAANNANPLPGTYVNITPNNQLIFARIFNTVTSQVEIITYTLFVNPVPVVSPMNITVCQSNPGGVATIDLNSYITMFTQGNLNMMVTFHETQVDAEVGMNALNSPYVNISPNPVLFVRVENPVTGCYAVTQFQIIVTPCEGQPGQPNNLTACADDGQGACFDLTVNTPLIMGNNNPANYSVQYFGDAALSAVITTPTSFCTQNNPAIVYASLTNTITGTSASTSFSLITQSYQDGTTPLTNMAQCDNDANGFITYNLTDVQAQITSGNTLTYYTALVNAQNMNVQITNPAVFNIAAQQAVVPIFVRETIVGGCDIIYSFNLFNALNCNAASNCINANPLCGSLGVPFPNTTNVASSGSTGCLNTTPNQTWFFMPVSAAGPIQLTISQQNVNGVATDVDYIVYGPFTNPAAPCSNPNLLSASVVSCSYSPNAVETAYISNAQPGQYYLLMVTNFNNSPGMITIVQSNEGQPNAGAIDCNGLKFQAFLDTNTNGVKDSGESLFPLGQFHYEKNDDGIVHHITAPTGIHRIYDIVPTNSYDVNFTVDAAYSSMYTVSPASYSNLTIAAGSGMTVYNFPVTVVQAYNDLAVGIVPFNAPRPGFVYQNKIVYTNLGNQTVASGTLTFNIDSNLTITANTQSGTTPTTSGFTFGFTNLAPFETRSMTVSMQVPTIPTVAAGQLLTNTASIEPLAGDTVPENNTNSAAQIIINAYDPNDKMESHGERILHSSFTANDYLYYTIRFENTGTASAINVRVNDVLEAQLDETTLRMVDASHAYELDRVGNNLNWRFDNIQLPVSVANTTIGKGYITFKIKPRPGYAIGDIINNAASIYFDFNPAIVTNIFSTEFVAALGLEQFADNSFVIYPNPATSQVTVSLADPAQNISAVRVYDLLGKTVLSQKTSDTSLNLEVSALDSGVYFVEVITDTNVKTVKKLTIK